APDERPEPALKRILITRAGDSPSTALERHPRQKPAADIVLDVTRSREATGFPPARVFPDGLEEQIASAAAAHARL
ncbi:MAG: hypothetical protein WAW53_11395, partial [Candidatus Dormiibacterota bacterium]